MSRIESEVQRWFRQLPPNFSLSVSEKELVRVVQLIYSDHRHFALTSAVREKTRESLAQGSSEGEVRIFICPPGSQDEVYKLKIVLRALWSDSWGGVHTTDGPEDSFQILSALADPLTFSIIASSPPVLLRENLRYISGLPSPPPETTSGEQWVLGGDAVGMVLAAHRRKGWEYSLKKVELPARRSHHLNAGSAASLLEQLTKRVPPGCFWFAGKIIETRDERTAPPLNIGAWFTSFRSGFIALRTTTIGAHFDGRLFPATGEYFATDGLGYESFKSPFPKSYVSTSQHYWPTMWAFKIFLWIAARLRLRAFITVATLRTIINLGPQWLRNFLGPTVRSKQRQPPPDSCRKGLEV